MHYSKIIIAALLLTASIVQAQTTMTLNDCRQHALKANHDIRMAEENAALADDLKQVALSQFFPRVTANGTYLWNGRNAHLLSDEQMTNLKDFKLVDLSTLTDILGTIAQTNPQLAMQLMQSLAQIGSNDFLLNPGQRIADALDMDFTNIYAGSLTVTQPIYLGGKIRAAYQAARLYDDMSHLQYEQEIENQLIAVDEAFWQVVSLQHKQQLAQQYCDLVRKLSRDVEAMAETGVATLADKTRVQVKLNEAEMTLAKATNGLELSRILLNQMCGLPLNQEYLLLEDTALLQRQPFDSIDMGQVLQNRSELKMLRLGEGIADAGVKLAASALLPNIAATGGYVVSNPNFYNGYDKSFGGSPMIGVVVNLPICHPDAIFATKAAKHKRNMLRLQREQAEEKVELQVTKLNYELEVANRKYIQAQTALRNAEDNLRNANESFAEGTISSSDLMQAQTAWMSAQSQLIDAEIEIRIDYTCLLQAMGINNYQK